MRERVFLFFEGFVPGDLYIVDCALEFLVLLLKFGVLGLNFSRILPESAELCLSLLKTTFSQFQSAEQFRFFRLQAANLLIGCQRLLWFVRHFGYFLFPKGFGDALHLKINSNEPVVFPGVLFQELIDDITIALE